VVGRKIGLERVKEVYTSSYGRDTSLLASFVTIQFLYIQFGIKFVTITIKIKT
jgi:hypothetical protein